MDSHSEWPNNDLVQETASKEIAYAKILPKNKNILCYFPKFGLTNNKCCSTDAVFSMCFYSLLAFEIQNKDKARLTQRLKNINCISPCDAADYENLNELFDITLRLTLHDFVMLLNGNNNDRNIIDKFIEYIHGSDHTVTTSEDAFKEFAKCLSMNIQLYTVDYTLRIIIESDAKESFGNISLCEIDSGKSNASYGMIFNINDVASVFPKLCSTVVISSDVIPDPPPVFKPSVSNPGNQSSAGVLNGMCEEHKEKRVLYCLACKKFLCKDCYCDHDDKAISCKKIKNFLINRDHKAYVNEKIASTLKVLENQQKMVLDTLAQVFNKTKSELEQYKCPYDKNKIREDMKNRRINDDQITNILNIRNQDVSDIITQSNKEAEESNRKIAQIISNLDQSSKNRDAILKNIPILFNSN